MSRKRPIKNEQYFRNIVRSRDNWTCQQCGRIEYLQVHHFASPKDYPLFATLPGNGITLCVYCHADAHPEVPRNLFIANVIKAEKEGCISAGKLAKELDIRPETVARKARKLGILKPMQKWMFTKEEANVIRQHSKLKKKKVKKIKKEKVKMVNITIIFSIEQYDWLKQAKKKRMQSISAILREFVNKEMENETKDFTNQ